MRTQVPEYNVLLIEDDAEEYVIIRDYLAQVPHSKFNLHWEEDFDAGLEAISAGKYDVCLLGNRNGLDFIREVKQKGGGIPIVFLTGWDNLETDLQAMEEGASDYLVKGQLNARFLERAIRYATHREKKRPIGKPMSGSSGGDQERGGKRTLSLQEQEEPPREDDESKPTKETENYRILFREMLNGLAVHEMILDETGVPINYRFLDVNPAFERMTGLRAADLLGKTVLEVLPGTERYWIDTYGRVALTGDPVSFEAYSGELRKYFFIRAFRPATNTFACIVEDISERKRVDELLRQSESRFRTMADHLPLIIWVTAIRHILTFSQSARSSQEEVDGRSSCIPTMRRRTPRSFSPVYEKCALFTMKPVSW
jgi:PAS domain S-box-containing protein